MRSRNTILLVANYDSDVGHAWWLMESLWAKLAEYYCPYNQIILAYPRINRLPPVIVNAPIEVVEQNFTKANLHHVLKSCSFLRRNQVRAIYFSDQPTWHWRYILYRLHGVKFIIVHDHSPGLRTPASKVRAGLKRLVHKLRWLSADGAIGATDFVRQRLIKINCVPPERAYVAPNGLPSCDAPTTANDLHDLFQIGKEKIILVMAARAHRSKGVSFILKCMAYLPEKERESLHFLFIGDGPGLSGFVAEAREMGVADHSTFVGRRDDVPSLLEGADIAMHPSEGEVGYSLSILEYMRAGLAVVVPNNPSVCGATQHEITGMIYPEGDTQAASEILIRLLRDSGLRKRLGTSAQEMVKRFSLETTYLALLEACEKITQNSLREG